jgi:hypothetical protein
MDLMSLGSFEQHFRSDILFGSHTILSNSTAAKTTDLFAHLVYWSIKQFEAFFFGRFTFFSNLLHRLVA